MIVGEANEDGKRMSREPVKSEIFTLNKVSNVIVLSIVHTFCEGTFQNLSSP